MPIISPNSIYFMLFEIKLTKRDGQTDGRMDGQTDGRGYEEEGEDGQTDGRGDEEEGEDGQTDGRGRRGG